MTVQYFERARFELPAQGRVQLGFVGLEMMNKDIAAGTIDAAMADPLPRPALQHELHRQRHRLSAPTGST